jgi:chromosome segregation ATPase
MSGDPTKELPKAQDEALEALTRRVDSLESAVEQKLKQTTPLSSQLTELREYVASCFRELMERQTRMEEQQTRMEQRQTRMEARQDAIEKEVREIGRTLRRINLDLATALRNQDDLDDRVAALETQPS